MGDLHSVAITPFSTMGAGGPRLSMKNSKFNTVRSRIGIKTSETAAKRYGVATLDRQGLKPDFLPLAGAAQGRVLII